MSTSRIYLRAKLACYATSLSMSVIANMAPILFLGFRDMYGISYSQLGLLVLVNFSTQLLVDLFLSFFSHKINTYVAIRITPVFALLGFAVFAASPLLFPGSVYVGLLIGTVLYSASGGLGEVLINPVIAAIPAENTEREVSKLHSVYAWGVVAVVPICSLFVMIFTMEMWQWLVIGFSVIPLLATLLFAGAKLPTIKQAESTGATLSQFKNPMLLICIFAIFLGGASECTMSQWASGYIEGALGIDKIWGDVFGVALFAAMLGLGRTLYAKYGKVVEHVLFLGAVGAFVCYVVAALSPIPVIGLIACALTGLFTSMLWPGTLISCTERIPSGGVFVYAIMAAGGDLGASVGPQLVGIVTDAVSAGTLHESFGMSPEAFGMKVGMLVGALFPLVASLVFFYLLRTRRRNN